MLNLQQYLEPGFISLILQSSKLNFKKRVITAYEY